MNTNNTNPQPIYAQPITDKSQKSKGYAVS